MLSTPLIPDEKGNYFNTDLTTIPNQNPQITNSLELLQKNSNERDNLSFFQLSFHEIFRDFIKISRTSLMISFTYFSNIILLMINLHFIGRFQDPSLVGAIGLGNVWINSLGINTIYGLNYGFEILASKAYGAVNYKMVGNYFKKGLIMDSLILIVFSIFSFFTEEIFIGLGQSPLVSKHLRDYVVNALPALFFSGFFDLRAIYFNAQEVFLAPVLIQIFTTFSHYFWCLLFFEYQIKGIAYAMNISLFINFLILELYNYIWSPRKASYMNWSLDIFKGFWEYVKLTVPIGLTTVLEEFSYEVNSLMAGLMQPDAILAAHVSLANLGALLYCLPEGFSTGINTYVGIAMGERKEHKAKRNAILGFIGSILIIIVSYVTLWILEDYWVYLLIDHEEVIYLIKKIFYLFALCGLLDTIQLALGSVVKVTGGGNLALILYLICLYILANPLSYVFGLTMEFGLEGIWSGILIGLALLGAMFLFVVMRIDWKKEIELVEFNEEVQEILGNIQ